LHANKELVGTEDMTGHGILVALRKKKFRYIGDYYVLANKKAAFYYAALTRLETFALTKEFMFKHMFKKFPGVHFDLLSVSFAKYIEDIRKPAGLKRSQTLKKLN
jgi:hypothetical protein